jgi:hypothetical protein
MYLTRSSLLLLDCLAALSCCLAFATAAPIAINFAADEPNGAGSAVTGSAGALGTAHWNNLAGAAGIESDLEDGEGNPTTVAIQWSSVNTWASTGRGEENNTAPAGNDRNLMTGYLDTTDQLGVSITVSGLNSLNAESYDVYVYLNASVNGRGGEYTIGGVTQSWIDQAAFNGTYTQGHEYLLFEDVVGDSFTLTSDPTGFRAPVNALEVVPNCCVDDDGDGVPNDDDLCPDSDLSSTVKIGACDTGVSNDFGGELVNADGCSLADIIADLLTSAADGARNHGQFVSRMARTLNELVGEDTITRDEHNALMGCVGAADASAFVP